MKTELPGTTTWTVDGLHRAVNSLLSEFFGDEIWIEGEIRNLNRSKNGHVYFDLIDSERAEESYPPALSITLFDRDRQVVNRFLKEQGGSVRITDGVRVRIRGRVGTFASRSSLQLRMTGIDPKFTLGVLDMLRQQVLAALEAEDLLDRNAGTTLTAVPTRIALVTSLGSAAHADALHEFDDAGLGLELFEFDARVQGANAGASIEAALQAADAYGVDLILLVRGGGARTDLAAFDLEIVARAIALRSVPVFTGIGHEVDASIADRVAHSSFKTPTAAAAAVCDLVHHAIEVFEEGWISVRDRCVDHLDRIDNELGSLTMVLGRSANRHLNRRATDIQNVLHNIRFSSLSRLSQTGMRLDDAARRTVMAPRRSLDLHNHRLDSLAAVARAHDPRLALARGWSITRDADGAVIRSVNGLAVGEIISTEVLDGTIHSAVQHTERRGESPDQTGTEPHEEADPMRKQAR